MFIKFGQVYITTAYPGVVKGWHYHRETDDNFTCIHGMMKVVLYDGRKDRQPIKRIVEFICGEKKSDTL